MALSRCPRSDCGGTSFELKEISPRDSRFKLNAVQCGVCGAVVGAMDYMNIGAEIEIVKKAVAKLEDKVDEIGSVLTAMARARAKR